MRQNKKHHSENCCPKCLRGKRVKRNLVEVPPKPPGARGFGPDNFLRMTSATDHEEDSQEEERTRSGEASAK